MIGLAFSSIVGPDAAIVERISRFVAVARPDLVSSVADFVEDDPPAHFVDRVRVFEIDRGGPSHTFFFDARDHAFFQYSGPRARAAKPGISETRALSLCTSYYRAAGYTDELRIRTVQTDERTLYLDFDRVRGGILLPFGSTVEFELDPANGALCSMMVRYWPRLDPILVPNPIGLERARAIAATAAMEARKRFTGSYPETLSESDNRIELRLAWPPAHPRVEGLAERARIDQIDRFESRPGLAYIGELQTWEQFNGRMSRFNVWIEIDAATGKVIYADAGEGFMGTAPEPKANQSAGWDLGVGPITVWRDGKTLRVTDGDIESVPPPKSAGGSVRLMLNRARWYASIRFYPKVGLVSREAAGRTVYGKPNHPLLRALRQLAKE